MGIGIAGLVSGFQQGYSFADDMQRRKKDDARRDADEAFREKTRGRQEKQWSEDDDYDAKRRAIMAEEYPSPKPSMTPVAAIGAPSVQAAPAVQPEPQDAPAIDAELSGAPDAAPRAPAPAAKPVATMGTGAARPDQYSDVGKTLRTVTRLAELDVASGKLDGMGLLTLQKTMQGIRSENMDKGISLLHQGRTEEAMALINSTGEHTGRVIGAQDGVYEAGGVKVPTRIITIETNNGEKRVINTAETMNQMAKMSEIVAQAQGGAQLKLSQDNAAEQRRHNGVVEQRQAAEIGERRSERAEARKNPILKQIEDEEEAQGAKYTPEERAERVAELTSKGRDNSTAKEWSAIEKDVRKTVADAVAGGAPAAEAIAQGEQLRQHYANQIAQRTVGQALAKASGTDRYATVYAEAKQAGMTDDMLAGMGYPAPGAKAAPAGAAPKQGPGAQRAAAGTLSASRRIPSPPTEKAWVGNNYQTTPEYAEWEKNHGAAYRKQQEGQSKRVTSALDRARG